MEDLTKKRRLRGGQRSSTKKFVAKVVEASPQLRNESPEEDLIKVVKTEPKHIEGKGQGFTEKIKTNGQKNINALSKSNEENADDLIGNRRNRRSYRRIRALFNSNERRAEQNGRTKRVFNTNASCRN